jgi:hypothetical protein
MVILLRKMKYYFENLYRLFTKSHECVTETEFFFAALELYFKKYDINTFS